MKAHWFFAKRLLGIMPVLVTIALLALLLSSCTWQEAVAMFRHIHAGYAIASVALATASIATGAMTLLVLFSAKHHLAWWGRFTLDYFYVQAICQLTPAQIGEITLPYIAGRGRFAPGEIAAGLVIQRITSLGIVVLFAVTGARQWVDPILLWSTVAVLVIAGLAVVVLITNRRTRLLMNRLISRLLGPVLYGFHDTWVRVLHNHRGRLAVHVILMFGRFVVAVAASFYLIAAFGIVVPFWKFAAMSALATLAAIIPISVNGIGVTEGIFVATLAGYGYGTEQVMVASLAGRILWFVNLLVWATAYWVLQIRHKSVA